MNSIGSKCIAILQSNKKVLGIASLLFVICAITSIINPAFRTSANISNTINWVALYGIISIGVSFVIVTGGIDLSIGSLIGLVGSLMGWCLTKLDWPIVPTLILLLLLSLLIGLAHGLLITKLNLQPFVVTLCGLLLYRGIARWVTGDDVVGFGDGFVFLKKLAVGRTYLTDQLYIPAPFFTMILIGIFAAILLNKTIYGRYLMAVGRNETAARYSGINTNFTKIFAYMFCSLMAGLAGILFALDLNSVQPSLQGEFFELYAIAAAVLGGCSLRGGEGSILGVIIGAALLRVLYNSISMVGIPSHVEFAIIGAVILAGVVVDELAKRYAAKRRAARQVD